MSLACPARCGEEGSERLATFPQGQIDGAPAGTIDENVEQDEDRRRLLREALDARLGRMNAGEERIERERGVSNDRKLPIEDETSLGKLFEEAHGLREIAANRLSRFRLEIDLASGSKGEAPKTVPFRLELPGPSPSGRSSTSFASIGRVPGGTGSSASVFAGRIGPPRFPGHGVIAELRDGTYSVLRRTR